MGTEGYEKSARSSSRSTNIAVADFAKIVALAGVYFCAGKLGLRLALLNASATAVWPPTGIALAAVLLLGYRVWPGIWLGAFLVNITTAGTVLTTLGIATGNTLEALVGAWLVNRFANGRYAFQKARDIFKFVLLAAILSTSLSATFGVTSLALGGFARLTDYFPVWITWWLGDAVSALIITPLIVVWATTPLSRWKRKQAEQSQARLAAIVESSDDAIVGKNLDGIVTSWNVSAERLFGYRASEIVGQPILIIIPPDRQEEERNILTLLRQGEHVEHYETVRVTKDGRQVPVSLTISPIKDSAGKIIGASKIARDITERTKVEAELVAWQRELELRVAERTAELTLAHKHLQAEVDARKRLEAEIARAVEREQQRLGQELHDGLGQQLTGIHYMMTALQVKLQRLSPTRAREAKRLQRMLQESIEQTRALAKGFYPVELERHGLLMALLETTSKTGQASDVLYSVQSDGDQACATLKGPLAIQLFRITQEAVHNAVKHAKANHILIRLAKVNGNITLTVKDNGVGLPPDVETTKGMGLHIMQYRARMIGGKLDFRNAPDGGAIVSCSVPVESCLTLHPPTQPEDRSAGHSAFLSP